MNTLDIGCGKVRTATVTLDIKPGPNVDVVHDITRVPWPFPDDTFDEVRAFDVLEHLPRDGAEEADSLFRVMIEVRRILRPGGVFIIKSPHQDNPLAWGVPAHTRVFNEHTFTWFAGSQEARVTRFDYPTFARMDLRVTRLYQVGPVSQFHVRKYAPRLATVLDRIGFGTKDELHVRLTK